MVFWILIGLIALAWVIAIVLPIADSWYDFSSTAAAAFAATVIIAIVGGTIMFVGDYKTAEHEPVMTADYGLRALVTEQATESHGEATFFLGFGYASSSTTEVESISFIQTADDGGNTIHKVGIEDSVIYEGSATPYVEVWGVRSTGNGWWWPWSGGSVGGPTTYRFHIPEGSIYEGYEVTP